VTKKAFFGGSFDPPHIGHLGVARAALDSGKCDEVVWFPAADPPHKQNHKRAPFADRMKMVALTIANEQNMSVSNFEAEAELHPSYTFNILAELEKRTGVRYILLIGADSLLSLHTWYNAHELVKNTDFITYPRPNSEVTIEKLRQHWDEDDAEKLIKSMLNGTFFEISSTEMKISMEKSSIRHHIIKEHGLLHNVNEYIRERGLYCI
jgi:nicotinate-nucleotide adenylyltransferase